MRGAERFVVLGLAHARSQWFRAVSRWSASAALAVDFVKAVSVEEVRSRLDSGRPFSALLVDGSLGGVDRDLFSRARAAGAAVVVVDDGNTGRDWIALGAAHVLPSDFEREILQRTLADHTKPIARGSLQLHDPGSTNAPTPDTGALIAVTGAGGAGRSTLAIALSQAAAEAAARPGAVVLADLDREADHAMLHDARDVVPGLLELVDAHRSDTPTPAEIRRLTYGVIERRYHLLLGFRRPRDWTAIRPQAFDAALHGLRRSYDVVIADLHPDVEGEATTGSLDVEERNLVQRVTLQRADATLVVGRAGLHGLHALLRVTRDLTELGVDAERVLLVINHAPRSPRVRAEIAAALATLGANANGATPTRSPVFVPRAKRVEDALHDGTRLPAQMGAVLWDALAPVLAVGSDDDREVSEPVLVAPGSLGSWPEDRDP